MPGGHGEGSNSGNSSSNKAEVMKKGMVPGEAGGLKKHDEEHHPKGTFEAQPLYQPDDKV